jgi:hypothetical protein
LQWGDAGKQQIDAGRRSPCRLRDRGKGVRSAPREEAWIADQFLDHCTSLSSEYHQRQIPLSPILNSATGTVNLSSHD